MAISVHSGAVANAGLPSLEVDNSLVSLTQCPDTVFPTD